MSKSTITRAEYTQLLGLKLLAEQNVKKLDEYRDVAASIAGEEEKFGHIGDMIWSDQSVDETLSKLKITVLPDPPRPAIAEGWVLEPIVIDERGPEERQGYLLVRETADRREEIPLDPKAAEIFLALQRALPPEHLRSEAKS
jgi:hypothetical protein